MISEGDPVSDHLRDLAADLRRLLEEPKKSSVFRITHEIFEVEGPTPDVAIVTHIFQGRDEEEARSYLKAHTKTDAFFRDAVEDGAYKGMKLKTKEDAGWVEEPDPVNSIAEKKLKLREQGQGFAKRGLDPPASLAMDPMDSPYYTQKDAED